jgi:hypothetical protein
MGMAGQFLDLNPEYRDDGWMENRMGDFTCPCGHNVEQDGKCPNGHKSPMLQAGMI